MYFVAYENRPKGGSAAPITNALIDDHPLVWIDKASEEYKRHFVTYIHFWAEVDDEMANLCKGVHRDGPADGQPKGG